jgi:hypothetical protein
VINRPDAKEADGPEERYHANVRGNLHGHQFNPFM